MAADHDDAHITQLEDAVRAVGRDLAALRRQRDQALAEVDRLRAVALEIEGQRSTSARREIELELESGLRRIRITVLEAGLREACDWMEDRGLLTTTLRLRALASEGVPVVTGTDPPSRGSS